MQRPPGGPQGGYGSAPPQYPGVNRVGPPGYPPQQQYAQQAPQQYAQQQGPPRPQQFAPPGSYAPPQQQYVPGPPQQQYAPPAPPAPPAFRRPPVPQQPAPVAEPFDLSQLLDGDVAGMEESKETKDEDEAEFFMPPKNSAPQTPAAPRGAFIASGVPVSGGVQAVPSDQIDTLRHEIQLLKAQLQQAEERTQGRLKAIAAASSNVMESTQLQAALKAAEDNSAVFYGFLNGGRDKKYKLYAELPFDAKTGVEKPQVRHKYEKKGANWLCLSYPRVVQQVLLKDARGVTNGTTVSLWYVVRVVSKAGEFERLWICDKSANASGELENSFSKFQMFVDAAGVSAAAASTTA